MSSSVASFSTAGLSAPQRSGYWADALAALCGHLHVDAFGADSLDGHIDHARISQLSLCRIEVSRHRVALPRACARAGKHPVIKVLFQTHGTSLFEQEDRRIALEPGDCLAYDVSRPHVITSEALTKHEVVIIPKDLVRRRGIPFELLPAQKLSARAGAARLAHGCLHSAFDEAATLSPEAASSAAEALLDLILLPFANAGLPHERTMPEALRWRAKLFIDENLRDPELSIETIAAELGCTKRYLHMVFGDEGTTIGRYIWQTRLDACRRVLESAEGRAMAVTDVAFSWGFSSSSHFSRLFKEAFGVSPSRIRSRAPR